MPRHTICKQIPRKVLSVLSISVSFGQCFFLHRHCSLGRPQVAQLCSCDIGRFIVWCACCISHLRNKIFEIDWNCKLMKARLCRKCRIESLWGYPSTLGMRNTLSRAQCKVIVLPLTFVNSSTFFLTMTWSFLYWLRKKVKHNIPHWGITRIKTTVS